MHNQNSSTDLKSQEWRSRLILFLRWLLGGLAGMGISSWFYFGIIDDAPTSSFLGDLLELVLFIPSFGHLYLFNQDALSYTHITDFFITFPVLFWGLIGALLTSGVKKQIRTGMILLVLFIVIGWIAFFRVLMDIPT